MVDPEALLLFLGREVLLLREGVTKARLGVTEELLGRAFPNGKHYGREVIELMTRQAVPDAPGIRHQELRVGIVLVHGR